MQHLNMSNLRGRKGETSGRYWKAESDKEFDLGSAEEAEEGYGGATKGMSRSQPNKGEAEQREARPRLGLRQPRA